MFDNIWLSWNSIGSDVFEMNQSNNNECRLGRKKLKEFKLEKLLELNNDSVKMYDFNALEDRNYKPKSEKQTSMNEFLCQLKNYSIFHFCCWIITRKYLTESNRLFVESNNSRILIGLENTFPNIRHLCAVWAILLKIALLQFVM